MNEHLKDFRMRWNLTQEEVSVLLGIRQPAWNMWETGKREIPGYVVKEISFFERLSKREKQKEIAVVKEGKLSLRRRAVGGVKRCRKGRSERS